MKVFKVHLGQVYKAIGNNTQVLIAGKKRSKWLGKVLTEKPGVFHGTHTLNERTLEKRYELMQ